MSAKLEAVPPFRVDGKFVRDAKGSLVLVCSEINPVCTLYSEDAIEAFKLQFVCPKCGRIEQRMVEATPEQCGIKGEQ